MRNILLGVCGGIAAYKSCELVRGLQRRGFTVQVLLTKSATEFVTSLTFETLTRRPAPSDLFGDRAHGTAHIEFARWADAFVLAPLTANTLANLAHGHAPDLLSTIYLAYRGPLFLAPAMNTKMWEHETVTANLATLRSRGAIVIGPQDGELACGEIGTGRMAEPETIADAVARHFGRSESLQGKRVVVTAGPTREYLDPVRFLSSPSTGKMGLAVAREAAWRGADVVVVHGPWTETIDFPAQAVAVGSASEMAEAVKKELPCDVFVGTAAVSDYHPAGTSTQKIKKGAKLTLELVATEDVLRTASDRRRPGDLVVGFAAETENLIPNAKLKLESKRLDLIVANPVFREERGFAREKTDAVLLGRSGVLKEFKEVEKSLVARTLWDAVEELRGKNSKA